MDIARPSSKSARSRTRLVVFLAAAVLAVSTILLVRSASSHRRTWVTLPRGSRTLSVLVDVPRKPHKGPVVILVHEVYGLTDWASGFADKLADNGYTVLAPDLLSGRGSGNGGFDSFASERDRTATLSGLDSDDVDADLDAVADYGKMLQSSNGKLALVGFSWGGWHAFQFATHRKDLTASFIFDGTGPDDVSGISAPVYGFYAGNDTSVDVSIADTVSAMKSAGKLYEPVTYDGADHGFMRLGEQLIPYSRANRSARDQALARLLQLLSARR